MFSLTVSHVTEYQQDHPVSLSVNVVLKTELMLNFMLRNSETDCTEELIPFFVFFNSLQISV